MKYAQIRKHDIANGTGIRVSIFFSGCTHNCKGCFNKEYQDFNYGTIWTEKETKQIIEYLNETYIEGLTLLGGEPMQQGENLLNLLKEIKKHSKKSIWVYSGYTFEEIMQDKIKSQILKECDVLVDGRFEIEKKNLRLRFKGSENQRIIDVRKSLKSGEVVEIC